MNGTRPQVALPAGRYFSLTWGIPDDFGGMTSALLRRSRSFVHFGGVSVDILTFDARTDYGRVEHSLRERGELVDGVSLINLWEWLRENDVAADAAGSLDLEKHPLFPLTADPAHLSAWRDDRELTRSRVVEDAVLQVDYYREDGSLLLSDRRDAPDGRSIVLCDRAGAPIRSWGSAWALYRFWLDLVRQRQPSFMIVDSKPVAEFIATYRRKRAVVIHVVHGSHSSVDGTGTVKLTPARSAVFQKLHAFDSVVFLTQRQRADVVLLLGARDNLAVIGNGGDVRPDAQPSPRAIGAGVMLASLTSRKRVEHAIRAVASAAVAHPEVSLDVYGDGPERERLAATIAELDAPVRLQGHVSGARELLGGASFLMLTSTSEGLPLVLVEAMAAGCIPIAYDISYGPADVIRDGRSGYLVAEGDPDAAARAIAELLDLSPHRVERLRRNARRAAQQFSDLAIVRLWSREMRSAERRKAARWAKDKVADANTSL